ncbi:prostaglandin E receptor 4 (subtype EP4) c [Brachionichthys hirsutus]|uniref:prostaglandin E receptor 4 (subtype EP4) c n=1 Tax=Brachionichthys hirsutus TaxID=412623 RepID=UPI00360443E4
MINDTLAFEELDINVSEPLRLLALGQNQSAFPALRLESKSLITSATMFAVGVLGNLVAIVVLCVSKKEQKETTFYTLVCGMAVTDMLGTCFTSPVVIATYVARRWPGGPPLCHFFSFSMLFFGSAGMSILCAMAVERFLAINHAYFYSQHAGRAMARGVLFAIYLANIALCVMPSVGFGKHVRHFPGTWCFLDWRATSPPAACYSFVYGGVMLALIAVTLLCNVAVCRSLIGMNQRTRIVRTELCAHGASRRSAAEIHMFWLLVLMTIVFLVCSIPLVVRIFVNQIHDPSYISAGGEPDYRSDLLAIRFASFNPILDPWVYILCRKNLLLKGCEKVKRKADRVKDTHGDKWVGGGHSPPSLNSHDTPRTYASTRAGNPQDNVEHRLSIRKTSFTDVTIRHAWECDPARVSFHPFSVESISNKGVQHVASPRRAVTPVFHDHVRPVDIVTFSASSSCQPAKCL